MFSSVFGTVVVRERVNRHTIGVSAGIDWTKSIFSPAGTRSPIGPRFPRYSVSTAARLAARKEARMRAIMFLLLDYEYRNVLA